MQGLGTTWHSIGMTVERIIYADPADFSTNFCIHSCQLPGSFSKPSCIPWQRTHPTHFLLCLSLAVPSSKEFSVSEERSLISVWEASDFDADVLTFCDLVCPHSWRQLFCCSCPNWLAAQRTWMLIFSTYLKNKTMKEVKQFFSSQIKSIGLIFMIVIGGF